MATSLSIPTTTLGVGTHTFGPVSAPVGVQHIELDISRTAGNFSLNSAAATTTLDIEADVSYDSGATWQMCFSAHAVGGTYVDDETGQTIVASNVYQTLPAPTTQTTEFRAVLTVSGQKVSVSGALILS